jgi:N-acetylglutamate synthase-like GNAT family acetyltransferase
MAILPEYQGKGLGNALVHKIHAGAKQQGVESMIYALIRDTNKIQHFPTDDARVISRYACYTFNL